MKVKLMFSHLASNRPKIKMAKVDGCTFFKRGDMWRHVEKSCTRLDHWVWTMILTIGKCVLERVGIAWKHQNGLCLDARIYEEILTNGAQKVLESETKRHEEQEARILKDIDTLNTEHPDEDRARLRQLIDALDKQQADFLKRVEKFEKERPACALDPFDVPLVVGGCEFKMEGDEFHHLGLGKYCKLHEHIGQVGDRQVRLFGKLGREVEGFAKKANEAIAMAMITTPSNLGKHITMEVAV